jgi:cyclophilin family peptidyl-prolyl cis-trans isomerase/HEAT repeat protein
MLLSMIVHIPDLGLRSFFLAVLLMVGVNQSVHAQRTPLSAKDVAEIVELTRIEDRRDFDLSTLQRIAAAQHPELRRRAALTIARLYDFRGRALLKAMRMERDTSVLATVVWATGQLVDTSAVAWLDSLLESPVSAQGVATEAAGAFGKIRTADTRARLATYLLSVQENSQTAPTIQEALLSYGRHSREADPAPMLRWTTSSNAAIRWRAAWGLSRPFDKTVQAALIELARDPSPDVRSWATHWLYTVRSDSLAAARSDATRAVLLNALADSDRRVRAEAIRAISTQADTVTLNRLVGLLTDQDMWLATLATEGIGTRGKAAMSAVPALTRATAADRRQWLRAVALRVLASLSLSAAQEPAIEFAKDSSVTLRRAAIGVFVRLGRDGRTGAESLLNDPDDAVRFNANAALLVIADSVTDVAGRRAARMIALKSADSETRSAAIATMSGWADSTDLPMLLNAWTAALHDRSPDMLGTIISVIGEIDNRDHKAAAAFFARNPIAPSEIAYQLAGQTFGWRTLDAWGSGRPIKSARTEADYKRIVNTLVVPAYNGAAPPRLRWETTVGPVDTDLNSLDAPLATDYILALTANGSMQNIRFSRVIANFVAQQDVVLDEQTPQRDEVSRERLVRGRLSWGSRIKSRGPGEAYDTGPAVYTFAHVPQPHNEGDFTSLGTIVHGMDVVDRIELGDFVTSVRVIRR